MKEVNYSVIGIRMAGEMPLPEVSVWVKFEAATNPRDAALSAIHHEWRNDEDVAKLWIIACSEENDGPIHIYSPMRGVPALELLRTSLGEDPCDSQTDGSSVGPEAGENGAECESYHDSRR